MPEFLLENGAVDAIASSIITLGNDHKTVEAGSWALWKLSACWRSSGEPIHTNNPFKLALSVYGSVATKYREPELVMPCAVLSGMFVAHRD